MRGRKEGRDQVTGCLPQGNKRSSQVGRIKGSLSLLSLQEWEQVLTQFAQGWRESEGLRGESSSKALYPFKPREAKSTRE